MSAPPRLPRLAASRVPRWAAALAATALVLSGCDLAPPYSRPPAPIPAAWPSGAAYAPASAGPAGLPWRQVLLDPKLARVVETALTQNRSLRAALASVVVARENWKAERSQLLPTLGAGGAANVTRGLANGRADSQSFSATIGVTSWEVDLFGRLRDLTREQFEAYLATDAGARSTRIAIIAATAESFAALASDEDSLKVSDDTLKTARQTVDITKRLLDSGLDSGLDYQNALTTFEQARASVAAYTTLVAQDLNALELEVGAEVGPDLRPTGLAELEAGVQAPPAGLSSTVLLQRPDVEEAEHTLKGGYAGIGAARAAFFPTITLTSGLGAASSALGSLFSSGSFAYSGSANGSVDLLGGPNRANLRAAQATRDEDLANYEKAIQTAFEEVSNDLARRGTITEQRSAERAFVEAAQKSYQLSYQLFQSGTGAFLDTLVAQRTLFTAQLDEISLILTDIDNRITLYQDIGADPGR